MFAILSAVLFGVTVFTIIIFINFVLTTERRFLNQRLKQFVQQQSSKKRSKIISWKQLLALPSKIFAARNTSQKLEKDILRAGIPLKGEEFLTINLFSCLAFGIIAVLLSGDVFVMIVFAAVGLMLPRIVLNVMKKRRIRSIENQIGDALSSMANSMRAGYSFLQSMEMISREMPDPIAGEFRKTLREINLGTPTQQALENMSKRIESEDLDLIITAILIQRQVGGNLAEVLDTISETIRERLRINGEIKTLTAQGKISGLTISLLPIVIGVIIFIINREYVMTLFMHQIGIILLVSGIVAQIIGIILIRKVVQIEV